MTEDQCVRSLCTKDQCLVWSATLNRCGTADALKKKKARLKKMTEKAEKKDSAKVVQLDKKVQKLKK